METLGSTRFMGCRPGKMRILPPNAFFRSPNDLHGAWLPLKFAIWEFLAIPSASSNMVMHAHRFGIHVWIPRLVLSYLL